MSRTVLNKNPSTMSQFLFHHQKSPEIPLLARKEYPWLSRRNLSDESVEARYYLLEYLSEAFGFSGELEQDADGKPLPILIPRQPQRYWSISHSANYVAGIVSLHPTGIDIAELSERHISLQGTHSEAEYARIGGKNWRNFYRLWAGKEAIIKKL
jgi:phosphopantetheinyl transferase